MKIYILGTLILLSIACSSTKVDNLGAFRNVDLIEAEVLPTQEQLKGKKEKLVINNIKNSSELTKNAGAGEAITSQLYRFLGETNVDMINRDVANKFQKEIALALENGADYEGPKVADYIIDGKVDHASFQVDYNAAYESVNLFTGKPYIVKASCTYSGSLQGSLGLYKIPENKLIKTIIINDIEQYSRDPILGGSTRTQIVSLFLGRQPPDECPVDQGLIAQLINNAAKESVRKTRVFLLNFFSPKGYISEMLQFDDTYIVKSTIGLADGLKEGLKTEIYSIVEKKDRLTGKINQEHRLIAVGKVSNQLGNNYSYIILNNTDEAKKIRLGNFVKVKHEKGIIEDITDFNPF